MYLPDELGQRIAEALAYAVVAAAEDVAETTEEPGYYSPEDVEKARTRLTRVEATRDDLEELRSGVVVYVPDDDAEPTEPTDETVGE